MKENIIALVDCDSFFVSCEQAADKSLQGKAVCVLSNNDGCVLARSKEAKKMGIKMGEPLFMAKKHSPDCVYLSGNYTLYSEFSRNVMAILRDFSPEVQVYSIDEAFLELSGLKRMHKANYLGIAEQIRDRIKSELDINVSIGISKSKVLAKLACEIAKNKPSPLAGEGSFSTRGTSVRKTGEGYKTRICIISKSKIPAILKETKVQEIWGIGKNTTRNFNKEGILTCDKLVEKPDDWLKSRFGRHGVELKHELLGECIYKVKAERKPPQSIQNTRSFPNFTSDLDYIKNALNIHIHTSCKRLRRFGGKCKTVSVMLRTKDFMVFYDKKSLKNLTNFELEISKVAIALVEKHYNPNLIYRSCGVTLEGLDFSEESQLSLFAEKNDKNFDKLGEALDKLEAKFGKNIVRTGFTCTDDIEEKEKVEGQLFS
jgi:nucleotidyltransferase/DNA polymerase involved in DNA repair